MSACDFLQQQFDAKLSTLQQVIDEKRANENKVVQLTKDIAVLEESIRQQSLQKETLEAQRKQLIGKKLFSTASSRHESTIQEINRNLRKQAKKIAKCEAEEERKQQKFLHEQRINELLSKTATVNSSTNSVTTGAVNGSRTSGTNGPVTTKTAPRRATYNLRPMYYERTRRPTSPVGRSSRTGMHDNEYRRSRYSYHLYPAGYVVQQRDLYDADMVLPREHGSYYDYEVCSPNRLKKIARELSSVLYDEDDSSFDPGGSEGFTDDYLYGY